MKTNGRNGVMKSRKNATRTVRCREREGESVLAPTAQIEQFEARVCGFDMRLRGIEERVFDRLNEISQTLSKYVRVERALIEALQERGIVTRSQLVDAAVREGTRNVDEA